MSTRWSLDSRELRALRPCYAPASQGEFKAYGRAGALRPLSAERLLERGCIMLPGTVRSRVKAGGGKGRAGGRQAQMVEDRLHRPGLREVGGDDPAPAPGPTARLGPGDAP